MRPLALAALLALAACASAPSALLDSRRHAPLRDVAALETWLAANPDGAGRTDVLYALCEARARMSEFRAAAQSCGEAIRREGDGVSEASRQALDFWRILSDTPPIRVSGEVDAPLSYGWTGMAELPVLVNGVTMGWGVDTGAELSLITESVARRLGVRMFAQDVHIHGSTPGTAAGRLGVIERMHIGGAQIMNVPVFVLPDAALTGPDGQAVPPIFGAPIIYAFGRAEFLDHGARLRLTAPAPTPLPGRIVWSDDGFALDLELPRGVLEAHLDTGANVTEFHQSARALLTSEQRAQLTTRMTTVAGVSGQVQREVYEAPALDLGAGGGTCRLPNVQFGEETGGDLQGRVGIDLVKACRRFVIDVSSMTFEAGQ